MHEEYADIANPIYDGAFKYLLDDNRIAKIFLSALIGAEILDLQFRPTEQRAFFNEFSVSIFRMDFAASIRTADGRHKQVLIEIQKAKLAEDIMRFRRYLGSQYTSEENYILQEEPGEFEVKKVAMEIFTIYFLGHTLAHTKEPVVWVRRGLYGQGGDPTKAIEGVREEFIDALSHDSIVVQIPYLKKRRKTELEKLLSIFDQSQRQAGKERFLSFNMEQYPEKYKEVARRLEKAASEKEVRDQMELEDNFINDLRERDRGEAIRMEKFQKQIEAERKLKTKAEKKAEKERQLKKDAEQKAEKERKLKKDAEQRATQAEQQAEKERKLKEEAFAKLASLEKELDAKKSNN